jgi:hypothetical protein
VVVNYDVNHDKFEVQSDVNHKIQTVEIQPKGKITGISITSQQVINLMADLLAKKLK